MRDVLSRSSVAVRDQAFSTHYEATFRFIDVIISSYYPEVNHNRFGSILRARDTALIIARKG